jgi:hypothetical protein
MKKIFIILILFITFSCSSVYKVRVVGVESWDESELCYLYVQKLNTANNTVYALPTYKDDSLLIPLKKISLGDEVKIKLLKKPKPRMTKITADENIFYTDRFGNTFMRVDDYYSPDFEGLYYIKIR